MTLGRVPHFVLLSHFLLWPFWPGVFSKLFNQLSLIHVDKDSFNDFFCRADVQATGLVWTLLGEACFLTRLLSLHGRRFLPSRRLSRCSFLQAASALQCCSLLIYGADFLALQPLFLRRKHQQLLNGPAQMISLLLLTIFLLAQLLGVIICIQLLSAFHRMRAMALNNTAQFCTLSNRQPSPSMPMAFTWRMLVELLATLVPPVFLFTIRLLCQFQWWQLPLAQALIKIALMSRFGACEWHFCVDDVVYYRIAEQPYHVKVSERCCVDGSVCPVLSGVRMENMWTPIPAGGRIVDCPDFDPLPIWARSKLNARVLPA